MSDRVIVDTDSLYTDIQAMLDDIRIIRNDHKFVNIMADEVNQIKEWEVSLKKHIEGPFNIIVIGDFKRGKSTLINAILGGDVVPVDALPETMTINKVSYGEESSCTAVLKNGKKAKLEISDLSRDNLKKIIAELPGKIEYVDVKFNNDLLKDISIIDTPGLGDIFKEFDEQVTDYLLNTDAVIYVVSARAPLSQTEQEFISAAVLPQSFSRIFVALNMVDILKNREDIEKMAAFTREKIETVTPDVKVFPVSALDEFCLKMKMARPVESLQDYLEDQFEYFRIYLESDIILQKDVIKTMRVATLADLMLGDITNHINLLVAALALNVSNLSELEGQYKNEDSALMKDIQKKTTSLSLDIDEMYYEAKDWIAEFLDRIRSEINSIKETASTSELQKHFQFYMIDKIKNSIFACATQHQKQISEKIDESAKSASLSIASYFGGVNTTIADSITDISWTNSDSAAFVTDFILDHIPGLQLGSIGIIAKAISGFIRQKTIAKRQQLFLDPILENFDNITIEVQNEMKAVYEKLKKSAVERLNKIYDTQIEQSLAAVRQAKQVLENEEMKKEDITAYFNEVLKKIAEHKETLQKYK